MKQIGRILSAAVLAVTGLMASPATSTAQTYRWKGADVSSLNEDFYLYNVGMGRFMVAGGGWGIQGMLLYQDYGAEMALVSNGTGTTDGYLIKSGVENSDTGDDAGKPIYLGINLPRWTSGQEWGNADATFGPMFEARTGGNGTLGSYSIKWEFEPVATDDGYHVYNMKETVTANGNDTILYMGAGYGVSSEMGTAAGWNVSVGDTATFTNTENFNFSFAAGKDKAAYYQWILVPKSELESSHLSSIEAGGGLNANMTYLIKDPFFDRNRNEGFKAWTSSNAATGNGTYRYDWYKNTTTNDRPYSTALFQKVQIDTKANGMYAFGSFDGIGSASQSFTAPATGTYEIECRGLSQGNEAKLFATVGSGANAVTEEAKLAAATGFTKCTRVYKSGYYNNYYGTSVTEVQLAAIGKALYDNEDGKYTVKVLVSAKAGDQITIGVKKAAANQSEACQSYYYYDTDLVAVDNFAIRYVGKGETLPYVLDEDAVSTDYMKNASYPEEVTVYMKRSFTLNKWNTFVSPLAITAAQVKQAFGDDAQVAKLVGVGGVTGKTGSIDFQTVDLTKEGTAIEATNMYLVKPTVDGVQMNVKTNNGSVSGKMYLLGRRTLDGSKLCDVNGDFKEPEISVGTDKEGATPQPQVAFKGTYVKLESDKGPQGGSYVFSGGNMYHLTSAMAIKGFRGWFVAPGAYSIKFNVGDGSVTSIEEVIANDMAGRTNNAVYTVDGVKVRDNATSLEGLPAGLYIFKGKTHLVK